ncbi:MAG: DNA polymerase III subunit beta [Clostridiales bacterium]|nr:DNA polymerase III subunit beta [Clostridiales bacterium]
MRFSVARGELVNALAIAGRAVSSRSTLPILSGFLISSSSSGGVVLQATDLEVSVRHTIPMAGIERPGSAVLPGKLLTDIIRSLPEAAVTIAVEGEVAIVSCLQSSFTLRVLPADDFPRFPEVDEKESFSLPATSVKDAVHHVIKATSRDETRPILTGILLAIDGPILKTVATDSYRLAVKESVLEQPNTQNVEVVVPARTLDEVVRSMDEKDSVSISVTDNQIVIRFRETTFVTRRIEGTFPNYRQLIPKDEETTVVVSREEMISAVKRVSLLAQHNAPLRLSVRAEDQTLSLSAKTHDVGDASEDLMAEVRGADVEIAFNHSFLIDGLLSAEGDTVSISIVSPLKPGVITSPQDSGFLYLLMPVRLS